MRYVARHYVRIGKMRYTPGEILTLEDEKTAKSMMARGALEPLSALSQDEAESDAADAECAEQEEAPLEESALTPEIDASDAIVPKARGRRKTK